MILQQLRKENRLYRRRIFGLRVVLLILLWGLLEGTLFRSLAGEQDALFWQDIGSAAAPFLPTEVLPLTGAECFIPPTGEEEKPQAVSFSYQAANHRYQLDGLWNDLGITMHLLEDKGLSAEDYTRRFGFPAGRAAGGQTLQDPKTSIRYLYQAAEDDRVLTEPDGYRSYQWQSSRDRKSYTDIATASARTCRLLPENLSFGSTYFRCTAAAGEQTFTLGANYAVMYYRLPTIRGLQIREV